MNISDETQSIELPEVFLWTAVVVQALVDWRAFHRRRRYSSSGFKRHYDSEYSAVLRWFFFSPDAEPFNLTYLCANFFDDGDRIKSHVHKCLEHNIEINNAAFRLKRVSPQGKKYRTRKTSLKRKKI